MSGSGGTADRLRLLVVNWQDRLNPRAGGAEVHLHQIFGRLAARGHRVEAVVSGWPGAAAEETVDGIRVHRVGRRHTFPLRVRAGCRSAGAPEAYDLLVEDVNKLPLFTPAWAGLPVVALVPHLFGATAFREASWPVAATVWAAERLMPPVYRKVPFQAISEGTAEDLETRGLGRAGLRIIRPGVDHDRFRPDAGAARWEEPTAVHVGRLKRYKGLGVMLEAFSILAEQGVAGRLFVAGRGDEAGRLEARAERLGLGDRVRFLGWVSETRKVELLRRAWVHLYPSPKEGWGITNVEAAACGTPCVASDSPGLRESVAHGRSGWLVPHGDAAAWAARIARLFGDREARERLSRGAIEHAAGFSWDRAACQTEVALRETLDREGGTGCR